MKRHPSCITLIHRELPSLHHEEIIVKREEVAMILTSLREQEGKEQRHGVINAGETACWERGCSAVPPCPEEGERDHAAGILCHHRIQSSLCSLLTAYLCKACDPGTGDLGPHETPSVAPTAHSQSATSHPFSRPSRDPAATW